MGRGELLHLFQILNNLKGYFLNIAFEWMNIINTHIQVTKSIEKVRNTLLVAMTNCFAATDTFDIIQVVYEYIICS